MGEFSIRFLKCHSSLWFILDVVVKKKKKNAMYREYRAVYSGTHYSNALYVYVHICENKDGGAHYKKWLKYECNKDDAEKVHVFRICPICIMATNLSSLHRILLSNFRTKNKNKKRNVDNT